MGIMSIYTQVITRTKKSLCYRPPSVSRQFVADLELFAVFISCNKPGLAGVSIVTRINTVECHRLETMGG